MGGADSVVIIWYVQIFLIEPPAKHDEILWHK